MQSTTGLSQRQAMNCGHRDSEGSGWEQLLSQMVPLKDVTVCQGGGGGAHLRSRTEIPPRALPRGSQLSLAGSLRPRRSPVRIPVDRAQDCAPSSVLPRPRCAQRRRDAALGPRSGRDRCQGPSGSLMPGRRYLGRGRLGCGEPLGDSWLTPLLPRAPVHPAALLAGARPLLLRGRVVLSAVAAGLFQA